MVLIQFRDLSSKSLCCFVDVQLFYNILYAMVTVSSIIMLESVPASFPCSNTSNLSQTSKIIRIRLQPFPFLIFLRRIYLFEILP